MRILPKRHENQRRYSTSLGRDGLANMLLQTEANSSPKAFPKDFSVERSPSSSIRHNANVFGSVYCSPHFENSFHVWQRPGNRTGVEICQLRST